jgi:hypothetical protein
MILSLRAEVKYLRLFTRLVALTILGLQVKKKRAISGPPALFRHKVRQPVTLTLTRKHHAKLKGAMERLELSRSDVIGLLIDQFADVVRIPHDLVMDDD